MVGLLGGREGLDLSDIREEEEAGVIGEWEEEGEGTEEEEEDGGGE